MDNEIVHRYFAAFSRSAIFRSNDRAPMGPLNYVFSSKALRNRSVISNPHLISGRSRVRRLLSSWGFSLVHTMVHFPPFAQFRFFSPTCPYSGTDAVSASPLCALSLHFNSRHSQRAISSIDRFQIPANDGPDVTASLSHTSRPLLLLRVRVFLQFPSGNWTHGHHI
jgi:hypothetical protein